MNGSLVRKWYTQLRESRFLLKIIGAYLKTRKSRCFIGITYLTQG